MKKVKLTDKRNWLAVLCCFVIVCGMALALTGCAKEPIECIQIRVETPWKATEGSQGYEMIEVPVRNEQGKELYRLSTYKPDTYYNDAKDLFREKYGYDPDSYLDDTRWREEIVSKLSPIDKYGNIVNQEAVDQDRALFSEKWDAAKREIIEEMCKDFLNTCIENESDIVSLLPMWVYADEEDLERIRDYPTLANVMHWEERLSGIQEGH